MIKVVHARRVFSLRGVFRRLLFFLLGQSLLRPQFFFTRCHDWLREITSGGFLLLPTPLFFFASVRKESPWAADFFPYPPQIFHRLSALLGLVVLIVPPFPD